MTRDKVKQVENLKNSNESSGTDYVIRLAYRDDAVSTIPNRNGTYTVPTAYNTYRYGMDVTPGTVFFERDYGLFGPCYKNLYREDRWNITYGRPSGLRLGENAFVYSAGDWNKIPATPAALEGRVLSELQRKVRQQGWSMSQTFGEMPKTIEHLVSTATTLFSLYKAVKTGSYTPGFWKIPQNRRLISDSDLRKLPSGKQLSKNAAQLWLELQYGWKPLIRDIYSAAEAIESGLTDPVSNYIVVKKVEDGQLTPSEWDSWDGHATVRRSGSHTYVVKAGIRMFISNETLARLGAHGLTNPMALAWELFLLSFVIDWFLPIKPFLEGLTNHLGFRYDDGYLTKYVKWQYDVVSSFDPPAYHCVDVDREYHYRAGQMGMLYKGDLPSTSEWGECFNREHMPLPIPPVPYWRMDLNKSKIISLLALVRSLR
uniref:Uncharacterized protein n=1 Tax=Beihai levi-like virus 24 TaxID=1922410 RepID=A0A1L3KI93_9VIRU|nr:hypothetical protein [Beihai levi-like virus 24]